MIARAIATFVFVSSSFSYLLADSAPVEIEYARINESALMLDLHLPSKNDAPALIVWIHGGAWLESRKPQKRTDRRHAGKRLGDRQR